MISPSIATCIIVAFILLFGVAVPVLDRFAPKYISYRWCVIVVVLGLLIGAVIDFDALSDEARRIILTGGLIISGLYVGLRTLEKVLANGWHRGSTLRASKGDLVVEVKSSEADNENLH